MITTDLHGLLQCQTQCGLFEFQTVYSFQSELTAFHVVFHSFTKADQHPQALKCFLFVLFHFYVAR